MSILVYQIRGFTVENEGFRFGDGSGSGRVSDRVAGGRSESFRRAFGRSKEAKSGQNEANMGPIRAPGNQKWSKSRLRVI